MLSVHQLGGRNIDRPRSIFLKISGCLSVRIVAISSGARVRHNFLCVFVQVDPDEVFSFDKAWDWDRSAGTSVVGDKTKGSKTQLGNGAIQFSKSVRAVRGATNDNHWSNIAGLGLAS
jgi:hypothetical protein